MKLIFQGDPIPQKRPKFHRIGNFVSTYDPSSQDKKELQKQLLGQKIEYYKEGALEFILKAYMKIPRMSQKKHNQIINTWHCKKPDADNILKLYQDLLEEVCYKNDGQIARHIVEKIYSDNPRVEIEINKL